MQAFTYLPLQQSLILTWLILSFFIPKYASASLRELSPYEVALTFDSLLNVGADAKAESLCMGQALRMFPLLLQAHRKVSPFIDTAKSRDTLLEEKCSKSWCALKMFSKAVFKTPLMGMSTLHSVQAVHLYHSAEGWKLVDFEELNNEQDSLKLRTGELGKPKKKSGPIFPVSRLIPSEIPDRLWLKVSMQSADSLPALPQGVNQKILRLGKNWALVQTQKFKAKTLNRNKSNIDSLAQCLTSNRYLDLTDTTLIAKANRLKQGAKNQFEIANRIYDFVSTSMRFRLGSELFGTSKEVLQRMQGDCSEAAVLTAALLRAAGIPSRVILGFATLNRGFFIGHAWAEAFIDGEWIGIDPALKEFPAGAGRLMFLRLDGAKDMRISASNLMMNLLANLEIEIEAAWKGKRALKMSLSPDNGDESQKFFQQLMDGFGKPN